MVQPVRKCQRSRYRIAILPGDKSINGAYHELMSTPNADALQLRSQSDALRGRANGVMVGSLIAFGWAFYAASGFAPASRYILIAIAAGVAVSLLIAGAKIMRIARSLPSATAAQTQARRRVWRWFWLNLLAEIVLLNIAITLLAAPDLRAYWIPAISVVVGLHFLPMATFFRAQSYWFGGAAMIAVAAAVTIFITHDPRNTSVMVHGEAIANAIILWCALAAGVVFALRASRQPNPGTRG